MKRGILFIALCCLMPALVWSANENLKYVDASGLTLVGKAMPTPANAIMTGAMANMPVAAFLWQPAPVFSDMLHFGLWSMLMLLAYTFITSWLLVCPVPMFSFKQKGKTQYVFAGCAVVLTALFAFAGLFATMILYIAISFASTNRNTK